MTDLIQWYGSHYGGGGIGLPFNKRNSDTTDWDYYESTEVPTASVNAPGISVGDDSMLTPSGVLLLNLNTIVETGLPSPNNFRSVILAYDSVNNTAVFYAISSYSWIGTDISNRNRSIFEVDRTQYIYVGGWNIVRWSGDGYFDFVGYLGSAPDDSPWRFLTSDTVTLWDDNPHDLQDVNTTSPVPGYACEFSSSQAVFAFEFAGHYYVQCASDAFWNSAHGQRSQDFMGCLLRTNVVPTKAEDIINSALSFRHALPYALPSDGADYAIHQNGWDMVAAKPFLWEDVAVISSMKYSTYVRDATSPTSDTVHDCEDLNFVWILRPDDSLVGALAIEWDTGSGENAGLALGAYLHPESGDIYAFCVTGIDSFVAYDDALSGGTSVKLRVYRLTSWDFSTDTYTWTEEATHDFDYSIWISYLPTMTSDEAALYFRITGEDLIYRLSLSDFSWTTENCPYVGSTLLTRFDSNAQSEVTLIGN